MGREQEWNISEAELEEMVEAEVLSKEVQYHARTGSSMAATTQSLRCC